MEDKEMLKKFGCGLFVVGVLMFGASAVNTTFAGYVMAEEKKCEKCGHLPSECAKTDCKCDCQKGKH